MFWKKKKISCKCIFLYSFLCSLVVFAYILGVGYLMMNGDKIFGKSPALLGVAAFLLLFVVSALITSLLMIGGPVYLYLQKDKKMAVKMLFFNLTWLVIITVIALMVHLFI